ncbi:MAG TPA: purple acid phosphatase [Prevotellaceae bacterium]|nr:purple acid phosphatase [Prevotellaceae bacterium]
MTKAYVLALLLFISVSVGSIAQIKNIHGPYLQNISATEATIVWEADKPSIGWVELAPDDGTNYYAKERKKFFDCTNGVKNTSLIHSVKLTGLQPGTTYRYRIYSQEVLSHKGIYVNYDGCIAASNVYSQKPPQFTTLDPNKTETSFVVLNDVHGEKDFITPLMDYADYKKKDLVFFNGDMISVLNKAEDFFTGFMDESIKLFAQEKSPYYSRGNHETRGEFATHFQDYFCPQIPHLYFTVRQGPIYFIMLDTGEDKPDSDIEYSGIVDYDGYRSQQADWLKTLANDPDYKSAKFRVVICHMPICVNKNNWHGPQDCVEKMAPILNGMNIDVMLSGHNHRDSFHEPDSTCQYPVLVNSNKGIISAETKENELIIRVIHKDGKEFTKKTFKAKH